MDEAEQMLIEMRTDLELIGESIDKRKAENKNLNEDVERLRKRDLNASIVLCYDNGVDDPFAREELKHVDVSVSDNIYVVESKTLTDLQAKYATLKASRDKLVEAIKYALGCGIMTETVCKKFEQALKEAEAIK